MAIHLYNFWFALFNRLPSTHPCIIYPNPTRKESAVNRSMTSEARLLLTNQCSVQKEKFSSYIHQKEPGSIPRLCLLMIKEFLDLTRCDGGAEGQEYPIRRGVAPTAPGQRQNARYQTKFGLWTGRPVQYRLSVLRRDRHWQERCK